MKLTRTIRDAIKNGYSSDFTSLLEEYGKWSRYFGCQGYGGSARGESYCIDDESASILDLVFCKMKAEHHGLYQLMSRFYIGKMSERQIVRELRALKDKNLRYATTVMVRERLIAGDKWVLEVLQNESD